MDLPDFRREIVPLWFKRGCGEIGARIAPVFHGFRYSESHDIFRFAFEHTQVSLL